jgi:hypothetical protein
MKEWLMILGTHVVVYSTDAIADRAFFDEVLGFSSIDAGHGWLIFALPPSELAVHPDEVGDRHELYLMCDDLERQIGELRDRGVSCGQIEHARWGALTHFRLPGGSSIGLYEPRHPSPLAGQPA